MYSFRFIERLAINVVGIFVVNMIPNKICFNDRKYLIINDVGRSEAI